MASGKSDNPRHMRVAGLVEAYLEQHKIGATEMAARVGMGPKNSAAVSQWRHAQMQVAPKYRPRLAELLGVTVEELAPDDHLATLEFPSRAMSIAMRTERLLRDRRNALGREKPKRRKDMLVLPEPVHALREHAMAVDALEGELIEAGADRVGTNVRVPARQVTVSPRSADVLTYGTNAEGKAVIKLVVAGSHKRMSKIFATLTHMGIVPDGDDDDE